MLNIGFYVHHQGSGHFIRALSIAQKLKNYHITFFGSGLKDFQDQIPGHIKQIYLDPDFDEGKIISDEPYPDVFHYAPLGIAGLRQRNAALVNWFSNSWPCLLIVDVSVEITLLARLCGVPSIVIKLNGHRNDLPHISAFQSCEKILAPYPKWMEDETTTAWLRDKTVFTGGFCRYSLSNRSCISPEKKNTVVVMIGSGGTKLTEDMLKNMAENCPGKSITVLGLKNIGPKLPDNLQFCGQVADPFEWLCEAELVVGSGGDNVVMEMAWLQKKFICIPEERPFEEQISKAKKLKEKGLAIIVNELENADWPELFLQAKNLDPAGWENMINPDATEIIVQEIDKICERLF